MPNLNFKILKTSQNSSSFVVNIPGGTPAWAQAIVTSIAALSTDMAALRTDMAALRTDMAARLTALRHSTSPVRMLALADNQAATGGTVLSPVPSETTGEMPPGVFPHSIQVLYGMPSADVNTLLSFYGLPLQGSLLVRRTRLRQAIGVRTDV